MSISSGIRWIQVKLADRLGAGSKGQSCDGTFTAGNLPEYSVSDNDGTTTDSGIPAANIALKSGVQQESYIAADDTGTANAYAVTLSPAPTIVKYSVVVLKVAHTNTGASTLAVNGGSAVSVKKESSSGLVDLASGDWQAGQIAIVISDGTVWQWVSGSGTGSGGTVPNQPYHLVLSVSGKPTGATTWQWECPSDITAGVTFQANFNGSAKGYIIGALPTVTATWTLYRVASGTTPPSTGTSIGSISISTSGAFTFTLSLTTFSPGDTMLAVYQSTADATLSGFGCVLPGYRAGTISTGGTGGFVQLGGDLGGTDLAPKVIGLQGVGISTTSPTNGQPLEYNSTTGLWTPTNPPLVIGFVINTGAAGTDVGPEFLAPRAGTFSKCKVRVKTSDGSTALTFRVKQNGTSVFTADQTIAAGTAAGTTVTITALTSSPLNVAADDVFSIDITSGSSSWVFTAQLET